MSNESDWFKIITTKTISEWSKAIKKQVHVVLNKVWLKINFNELTGFHKGEGFESISNFWNKKIVD